MRHPVFWNWEMVLTCNFRCTYCNYTCLGWERHHPMNVFPGLGRLTEVWTRLQDLYGTMHIEISGGECTTYPSWDAVINMLVGLHTVSLDTNLSLDVERFSSLVDLRRVRMSTSFHPQFAELDGFLRKCLYLKERDVSDIFVNYVAFPDQLEDMASCKRAFNEHGIRFYIQPFQGVYKKRAVYPDSYTEEERRVIDEVLALPGEDSNISRGRFAWKGSALRTGTEDQLRKINEERRKRGEEPLGAPGAESAHRGADTLPEGAECGSPTGSPPPRDPVRCRMGQRYAKTYVNGDTFRCCAKPNDERPAPKLAEKLHLGNLFLDDDLRLLEDPGLCDFEPCPCDRCMVLGEERRWEERWCAPHLG